MESTSPRSHSLFDAVRLINTALLTVKSESDLYQRICETLVRAEDTCSCWIGLVEPGTCIVKPVAQAGFEDAHIPSMEVAGDDGEHGLGPAEVAIKTRQPFVVGDILRDPRLASWREEALRKGYASIAALPLVHAGEIVGTLNVYSAKSHAFGGEQMALLREVASNIAVGIRSLRLEEEIKTSKELVETVFDSLSDLVCVVDARDYRILRVNGAFLRALGLREEEVVGQSCYHITHRQVKPCLVCHVRDALRAGVSLTREDVYVQKDGTRVYVEVSTCALEEKGAGHTKVVQVARNITGHKLAQQELQEALGKLRRMMDGTVNALASITESRDPYTAGHQRRVAELNYAIARQLGLSDERAEGARVAGLLHDIGKIYVPVEILSKPGRLTELEFGIIKTHPTVSHEVLRTIEFPWPVAQAALQHHERLDGSGYPQGLSGNAILMESRILAVSDVVEAMSSHRPYRPALGLARAMEEIRQNKGVLYDGDVVEACLSVLGRPDFDFG